MKAKEIVAKEVARQAEFGYEPSWEDFVEAGYKAGYDKRESEFVYNPDYLKFQDGVKAGKESRDPEIRELRIEVGSIAFEKGKKAGRSEVVEWINKLIIGIEGCKFEERLDGDKGCIVLDMNENQWEAQKKDWGLNDGS